MSRGLAGALLALALWGCANHPVANAAAPADHSGCGTVAADRSRDAGYNGFDADMQRRIYAWTYADCSGWVRRNGAPLVAKD